MRKEWILILCAALILAACGSNQSAPAATQTDPTLQEVIPPDVALNVQNAASAALGVPLDSVEIQDVVKMDWPDSCLGLPEGDEVCAEVITPGWLLTFNIDNQEYRYRVDATGTVIRLEP